MATAGGRTFLEDLSLELTNVAALLAQYAERDAGRREAAAGERVTVRQVEGVLAARYARSAVFGLDLANPGWSLMLELFRAYLEQRPVRLARLATDARVAATTAFRWMDLLTEAGFVRREADPARDGATLLSLTPAGSDAMEDYFVVVRLGWAKA
jgi:DNA-binding MarR family transcriptional regulator